MPHNIEQFANGQAAFASAREVPWHKLGTVTPGAMTAAEAAKIALLAGWDVRLRPIYTAVNVGDYMEELEVPGRMATVRRNPVHGGADVLGVVGDRYKVIQNEEAFEVLDHIVDEGGAHFETAGSLDGGRKVFMSMKMPEGIQIGGEDAHDVYLLAHNSHDGSSAFTLAVTPVRVVCQNTLTMGLKAAKQSWTLRHTSNVQSRIQEARNSLALTFKYMESFEAELQQMLDTEITHKQFREITKDLLPINESSGEGWQRRTLRRRGELEQLWAAADTNEFGRGTKYAAYNAITEYADWIMPMRGADPDGSRRAQRALLTPSVQSFKDRGLALVRAA